MDDLRGTGVALVTPFNEDGTIDYQGLKAVLNYTQPHVDYFVVMGTTGESVTCSKEEKQAILKFCIANNPNNLPIVYGIGGNNTQAILKEIQETNLEQVSAILSVSPYYNKPSQRGIQAHFEKIADESPIPIILYNVPGRTGSNMLAETTLNLAQHKNIIAIKEASGDLNQCNEIVLHKPDDFMLISGEDLQTNEIIHLGGKGAISVLANGFPDEYCRGVQLAIDGSQAESANVFDTFQQINPLMYQESNPVGIKEVLRMKKVCGNQVRLPLLKVSEALSNEIESALNLRA